MLQLKETISISSPLELDYLEPPSGEEDLFDGTLVGWNKQVNMFIAFCEYFQSKSKKISLYFFVEEFFTIMLNTFQTERPETMDAKIIVNTQVLLDKRSGAYPQTIVSDIH